MVITVDTNVIFSALHSHRGASHHIFRLILAEKVRLALSYIRDFQRGELKGFGFEVITPKDFCQEWRAYDEHTSRHD